MNRALLPLLAATATAITLNASANPTSGIDEMTIIGSKLDVRKVAGSGAVIDNDQIATEVSTDINQLLKTVSGVYVREEDGYGLRPNFGIRGATSERSEKSHFNGGWCAHCSGSLLESRGLLFSYDDADEWCRGIKRGTVAAPRTTDRRRGY